MSRLHGIFGSLLVVERRKKRYGSVVYLDGCDHVHAVSCLLRKMRNPEIIEVQKEEKPLCTDRNTDRSEVLTINERLHQQARKLTTLYHCDPDRYKNFSIECLEKEMDPVLTDFITTVTKPVRRNKQPNSADKNSTKHIRQMYALSVLLFTVDTACVMPLHMLLAEAVLCHSGSIELLHILNRVGATAAFETVKRLSTYIVQERISRGILPELKTNSLTVVSVDNIDILQLML